MDPTRLALRVGSTGSLPEPFCVEVGRRLLLAELQFHAWVLRRVEKVTLERDRSVSRTVSVEFSIRDDAPTFVSDSGRRLRLIPLSMMRRRTLVNLELRDEHDDAITMPGLRLSQQLDQSILLAAAAAFDPAVVTNEDLRAFVRDAIAGERDEVMRAYDQFDGKAGVAPLTLPDGLRDDALFTTAVNRFRRNFTLYAFLDDADPAVGAHRLLRMSFDEPTAWNYQTPILKGKAPEPIRYRPGIHSAWSLKESLRHASASLGFSATRVRFQVPGAEKAASYHFEITAPPGVQVVNATLLAGRPNEVKGRLSTDRIVGHSPTVGLHAIEVPDESLCRVQVDLRAKARGWLTTMLVASLAILAVMLSVGYHWALRYPATAASDKANTAPEQITNAVLILVTTSAAIAALVAQRDFGDVGSRFVSGVRAFGTAAIALPVTAAAFLVYSGLRPTGSHVAERWALGVLTVAAAVPFAVISIAWWKSVRAERHGLIEESPWDMTWDSTEDDSSAPKPKSPQPKPESFAAACEEYGFDRPAVGVRSAEGWHEIYCGSDQAHRDAVAALAHPWRVGQTGARGCAAFRTDCATRERCRSV